MAGRRSAPTLTDLHKALTRRLLEELFNTGNLALAEALVAADYVGYDVASPTPARGPAGLKDLVDRYRRAFPDLCFTIEDQIAEGEVVVTRWRWRCTNPGRRLGVSAAPAELTASGIRLTRLAGGQVVEEHVQWDTLGLLQQLGAVPPWGPTGWPAPARVPGAIRVDEGRLTEAGAVLARAFGEDPLYVYVLPDATERAQLLPAYFTAAATYGHRFGELHGTAGTVTGVAVWIPPASGAMTPARLAAAGFPQATARFGAAARGRLVAVVDHLNHVHQCAMPAPHWYLLMLGVDPPRQGRGIGGGLLQPVLACADAAGQPCYLETTQARNLPFYQRHGFAVVVDADAPGSGLHYWTMRRQPRSASRLPADT